MRSIGITLGDPAGIGPEIIHAALASGRLPGTFAYEIIGSTEGIIPGQPNTASARAALVALEEAAGRALAGKLAAVVTGPIAKKPLHDIGFPFPGQTEFFAARTRTPNHAMCLTGGRLTVALVTIHVPVREIASSLEGAEIIRVGRLLAGFLRERGLARPRIAVAGLNPHAGEGGDIGREEIELIGPAISELQRGDGVAEFTGPHAPDTVFNAAVAGEHDAVLCMYHDQGLIPLKLHAFDEGVNVTLGLPFPRTSPDHGTAFGIAGKGLARPDSMIAAIRLAAELAG